jgi:hypothetical protein
LSAAKRLLRRESCHWQNARRIMLVFSCTVAPVLLSVMPKERERFYLLPGMGGSAMRRKRKRVLRWSIVAGVFVSAILAAVLYLLYQKSAR